MGDEKHRDHVLMALRAAESELCRRWTTGNRVPAPPTLLAAFHQPPDLARTDGEQDAGGRIFRFLRIPKRTGRSISTTFSTVSWHPMKSYALGAESIVWYGRITFSHGNWYEWLVNAGGAAARPLSQGKHTEKRVLP